MYFKISTFFKISLEHLYNNIVKKYYKKNYLIAKKNAILNFQIFQHLKKSNENNEDF